jgi:protein O-mannosyl-transferase
MSSARLAVAVSAGLFVLTIIAFGDILWSGKYGFVNFDDYTYVRDNPHVHAGLGGASLRWAMTSLEAFNWHPLTWLSLQLDHDMNGARAAGYHRTNVLLHAVNAVLLFLVLRRMTAAIWPSAAVAALFAVHPLHVESVAWIAERKDVLSTMFWMLTMLAHARFAEQPGAGRYLLVVLFLMLGLMSKPMLVTLPCVLLLLDYWPLRRFPFSPPEPIAAAEGSTEPQGSLLITHHSSHITHPPCSTLRLIAEKIPLLALAAICCLLTIRAQGMLIHSSQAYYPFSARVLNALVSYVVYLRQMLWPVDLAALYVHPSTALAPAHALAPGLLLGGLTLAALIWRRSRPYLLVGWLWYLGTLVPVIGLLQVGQQARADRYTYVPLIGIFIAVSWGAAEWLGKWKFGRVLWFAAMSLVILVCSAATWLQVSHWRDSKSLWDRAALISGVNPRLHFIAAELYLEHGEVAGAIPHAEAFARMQPDDWEAHRLLGVALERDGRRDEAVAAMARAVELEPQSAVVRKQMARFFWSQGNIPAAYLEFAVIERLDPDSAEAQHYRGTMLQRQRRLADAVRCFQEAVRLVPGSPLYYCDLAFAVEEQGNSFGASLYYRRASQLYPEWPAEHDRLARILAGDPDPLRRDGAEAVRRARQSCFATNHRYPPYLETLATAYAQAGRFKEAADTAQRAIDLLAQEADSELARRLKLSLVRYKNALPAQASK